MAHTAYPKTPNKHKLEAPINTIMDLWYARHGDDVSSIDRRSLVKATVDGDWLEQQMCALVYLYGRDRIGSFDSRGDILFNAVDCAYRLYISENHLFDLIKFRLRLKDDDGNRREQSASHPHT